MTGDGSKSRVGFRTTAGAVHVTDSLENETAVVEVGTDAEPDLTPALPDLFPFPIDRAVSFEASELTLPNVADVRLRDEHGETVAELMESCEFPTDTYCIEVTGSVKLYIRVRDTALATNGLGGEEPVRIAFEEPVVVTVGARSQHTRPEATITVPDDPEALMTAVSALGSSIKEFSVERSWPTLRGYPPRFERGEELDVPNHLSIPETGVRITVPPTFANVYRVASLAYYLGARVEPGDPAIHLEDGYVEPLPTDGSAMERRVDELLGQFLLLDSLVRVEGYVPSDRIEYEKIGPKLSFYPPKLYDRSIPEQLLEYLDVDSETTAPYVPEPPVHAQLRPGPSDIELLPHLVHGLASIRVACPSAPSADPSAEGRPTERAGEGPLGLPSGIHAVTARGSERLDGLSAAPNGTALLTPATYENRISHAPPTEGDATVRFLVDDDRRARTILEVVGESDAPADPSVSVVSEPTVRAVEAALTDPGIDACYVSLRTEEGKFVCSDGRFDPTALELVGPSLVAIEGAVDADVGGSVVDGGAYLTAFLDRDPGIRPLWWFARLLAVGTTVAEAVSLSGVERVTPLRYVGDPTHRVVSPEKGPVKAVVQFRSRDDEKFDVTCSMELSVGVNVGTEVSFDMGWQKNRVSLAGGVDRSPVIPVTSERVCELVSFSEIVVTVDGVPLFDGDDPTPADVERIARSAREFDDVTSDD